MYASFMKHTPIARRRRGRVVTTKTRATHCELWGRSILLPRNGAWTTDRLTSIVLLPRVREPLEGTRPPLMCDHVVTSLSGESHSSTLMISIWMKTFRKLNINGICIQTLEVHGYTWSSLFSFMARPKCNSERSIWMAQFRSLNINGIDPLARTRNFK